MSDRVRMMFIDVDGTLHGRQGVHPEIWAAVAQAREAGLPLSLCTGRPGSGVARRYAARLAPNGPHIFEAGACVTTAEGEVVHAEPLGPLYPQLIEQARRHDVVAEIYTADGRYVVDQITQDVTDHEALLEISVERVPDLLALDPAADQIVRVQWLIPEGPARAPMLDFIAATPGLDVHQGRSPSMPHIWFCGVTRAGVSKASAALRVAQHYGLADLSEAAMIGDGLNDLALLKVVGHPMTLAGAEPEVLDLVRQRGGPVLPSVDEGGAAVGIRAALG